jgi:hypothetical protein
MLNLIMIGVIMLSIITLSVVMLNVIMLNVVMLNVLAPYFPLQCERLSRITTPGDPYCNAFYSCN